jgi:cytochrome c biogenesis protein CcdA
MELAQVAQTAQQVSGLSLLGTALLLGIRHGIDWDHIAAITDIASTTTTIQVAEGGLAATAGGAAAFARKRGRPTFGQLELRAMWLSFLYAVGHASVVFVLGLLALSFTAILPAWIDPLMERVVGITLLILGLWVLCSVARYLRGEGGFRLQSRWMLVFAGVRHGWHRLQHLLAGRHHDEPFRVDQYGPKTAFGVGMIHGIGAETGSQALIIAAVGGAGSQGLGVAMLVAFAIGLVISNAIVAALAATGFISSARARPFFVAIGVLTGVFSLVIGAFFTLGVGTGLPDLQEVFGSLKLISGPTMLAS